ncbi:hypothetical protein SDC9_105461 [bioreactor metagenome]|uniref:Uncharacterized protein n=1 Tax=bioreactor metagenome TaxID=1076179 RepID=A0A645AZQ2_9ZZZZ
MELLECAALQVSAKSDFHLKSDSAKDNDDRHLKEHRPRNDGKERNEPLKRPRDDEMVNGVGLKERNDDVNTAREQRDEDDVDEVPLVGTQQR